MKNKHWIPFAVFVVLAGCYFGFSVVFDSLHLANHLFGVCALFVVFSASTWLMQSALNKSPEAQVQRFMVASSVQLIACLFLLLISKVIWSSSFRMFVWIFLPVFFAMLVFQAIWMLRKVNR
jgi:hypothetical protein